MIGRKFIIFFSIGLLAFSSCKTQKAATVSSPKKSTSDTLSYKESRQASSLFLSGMKYYLLEDYDKAMEFFKKSHAIHPNSAGTNFQIAQIYIGSGYPKEGLPYAEKALALNDENIYYYQLLANCYTQIAEDAASEKIRKLNVQQAAKTFEALVAKFPSEEDTYFELANLYLQLGEVEKGLQSIDKIEAKYGVTEEISTQKQQIYLHIGQFDNAVKEGEKLINTFPNQKKYIVNLAKLYFQNDRIEETKSTLSRIDDESDLDGESKVMLSDIYWSLGDSEKSTKLLLEVFNDPEYEESSKINIAVGFVNSYGKRLTSAELESACKSIVRLHPDNAKSYVVYGDFLLKDGRKKEARSAYLKGLAIDDSYYQVWQNIIILDSDLNEQDSIIEHTNRALEIFPNQGVFWYYNGSAHLTKKNYQKSVYAFNKAKSLTSNENTLIIIINAQLGDAYNGLGDYANSDKAYEEVLSIDPNNAHVLNNYSYFLSLRNEKLDSAVEMCEKLIALAPENSTYLDTYGWVLYKQGKYEEAKDMLQRAINGSQDGTIIEHYGDVLFKLGEKDEAIEYWEKAKATGDYSELLEKKLKDGELYE